ncbi:hypothetical protein CLV47_103255 [Antricoccus suffuscus]|uniref:Uncharacterized protein n=1 Tax=Antricoccus suffuscus TaxID=1629062 RepID=A0A2T1A3Y8_9ACTN|nr:hypothetical protein [Antricoccus suffuscus]PRZ43197.1 hypothetical protein CLV47_103255 [Antricoccus suffuscus]
MQATGAAGGGAAVCGPGAVGAADPAGASAPDDIAEAEGTAESAGEAGPPLAAADPDTDGSDEAVDEAVDDEEDAADAAALAGVPDPAKPIWAAPQKIRASATIRPASAMARRRQYTAGCSGPTGDSTIEN